MHCGILPRHNHRIDNERFTRYGKDRPRKDKVGKKTCFPREKRHKHMQNRSKTVAKHLGPNHEIPGRISHEKLDFFCQPCLWRTTSGEFPDKATQKHSQRFPLQTCKKQGDSINAQYRFATNSPLSEFTPLKHLHCAYGVPYTRVKKRHQNILQTTNCLTRPLKTQSDIKIKIQTPDIASIPNERNSNRKSKRSGARKQSTCAKL